jgi:hypothetical protein
VRREVGGDNAVGKQYVDYFEIKSIQYTLSFTR